MIFYIHDPLVLLGHAIHVYIRDKDWEREREKKPYLYYTWPVIKLFLYVIGI